MPSLFISIYKPRYGNFKHWALFLDRPAAPLIIEAAGEHPSFTKSLVHGDPNNDPMNERNILVADINDTDLQELMTIVDKAKIDNEVLMWNCQDYVLEILEELHNQCIIDEQDDHYERGVNLAKRKYLGPML